MAVIEQADIRDIGHLTEITKKSKAYWGYSEKDLSDWDEQLTISEDYFERSVIYKSVEGNKIAGYYAFLKEDKDKETIRLDYLFVSPGFIGKGVGTRLLKHFVDLVKSGTNAKSIILEADPNAQGFYEKSGFEQAGQTESSIRDRYLPIMELKIKSK